MLFTARLIDAIYAFDGAAFTVACQKDLKHHEALQTTLTAFYTAIREYSAAYQSATTNTSLGATVMVRPDLLDTHILALTKLAKKHGHDEQLMRWLKATLVILMMGVGLNNQSQEYLDEARSSAAMISELAEASASESRRESALLLVWQIYAALIVRKDQEGMLALADWAYKNRSECAWVLDSKAVFVPVADTFGRCSARSPLFNRMFLSFHPEGHTRQQLRDALDFYLDTLEGRLTACQYKQKFGDGQAIMGSIETLFYPQTLEEEIVTCCLLEYSQLGYSAKMVTRLCALGLNELAHRVILSAPKTGIMNVDGYGQRTLVLLANGFAEEAFVAGSTYLQMHGRDPRVLLAHAANALRFESKRQHAIDVLGMAELGEAKQARLLMAKARLLGGEFEALALLLAPPHTFEELFLAALGRAQQGGEENLGEAKALVERSLEIEPTYVPAWTLLCLILSAQGENEAALAICTDELDALPALDTTLALVQVALLDTLGHPRQALETLADVVAVVFQVEPKGNNNRRGSEPGGTDDYYTVVEGQETEALDTSNGDGNGNDAGNGNDTLTSEPALPQPAKGSTSTRPLESILLYDRPFIDKPLVERELKVRPLTAVDRITLSWLKPRHDIPESLLPAHDILAYQRTRWHPKLLASQIWYEAALVLLHTGNPLLVEAAQQANDNAFQINEIDASFFHINALIASASGQPAMAKTFSQIGLAMDEGHEGCRKMLNSSREGAGKKEEWVPIRPWSFINWL